MLAQRLIQRQHPRGVHFPHLGHVLGEQSSPQKFCQHRLRQLIRMQIGSLFDRSQPLDRWSGSHNPPDAQPRKGYLRETVDVNHQVGTIQVLQRRHALIPRVQPSVNVIFHHRNLISRRQVQHFAP